MNIEQVDVSRLETEQESCIVAADSVMIVSQATLEDAGEQLRAVKTYMKNVKATFDGPKRLAHEAHRAITALEKKFLDPLAQAERNIKGKVGLYQAQQERIRRDEEDRLRKIAQQQEEDRRLAEAERLEAEGDTEAAEQVVSAPVATPVVVVPSRVMKVAGVSTRKTWKFRIVDPASIPLQWMLPNEKAIGQHARSMCAKANIPGVEFYCEGSVAARSY